MWLYIHLDIVLSNDAFNLQRKRSPVITNSNNTHMVEYDDNNTIDKGVEEEDEEGTLCNICVSHSQLS